MTSLDLAVAKGVLAKPFIWDPVLEVLAERGALHEKGYVDHLTASGLSVTAIGGVGVDSSVVAQTLDHDMPEALGFIEDAVAGMDSHVQRLLDFSRR